eukprot:153668-Chlamydomonas_euryale.AAC.3
MVYEDCPGEGAGGSPAPGRLEGRAGRMVCVSRDGRGRRRHRGWGEKGGYCKGCNPAKRHVGKLPGLLGWGCR